MTNLLIFIASSDAEKTRKHNIFDCGNFYM
jgi:hypothetical protein